MVELYKILIFALIPTTLVSFFYKIYFQIRIKNPEKPVSFFSIFIRFYYLTDLLPLSMKSHDIKEKRLRKRANIALAIFYLCFISIQVISIIVAHSS
jgi:hypothetical protein